MGYGYADEEEDADDVEIDCDVRAETDKALLIYDGKREAWIPKSQIKDKMVDKKTQKVTQITVGNWIAKAKGLV